MKHILGGEFLKKNDNRQNIFGSGFYKNSLSISNFNWDSETIYI